MQMWENITVDLMERSLDSFYLENKNRTILSQKVVVFSEYLSFRGLPWYISLKVLSQACLAESSN